MTSMIGDNTNTNDTAVMQAGITVGASTSVTLVTTVINETVRVVFSNDGNQDVFIKLQAASVDNDKKGFILHKGTASDIMTLPNMYIGEVSAIARNGTTTIFTTVY